MHPEFVIYRHVGGKSIVPKVERIFRLLGHQIEWSPYIRHLHVDGYDFLCNRCYERFFMPSKNFAPFSVDIEYPLYFVCE
jgi:hypothetical protein